MGIAERHKVLIAEDEEGLRFVLDRLLKHEGCETDLAADGAEAIEKAASQPYDLYILDMKMPKASGMDVLRSIRSRYPDALVVIMTAFGSQKLAIEALQAGAYDYFTKPFEMEELRVILRRALEKQALLRKVETLEKQLGDQGERRFHRLIGTGEKMQRVFDLVRRVSGHDITVLITGESGVGKELVAEAIHASGAGPDQPFIRVNCAAIPEHLLESELFGHGKGAFTGAIAAKPGKFEMANGGSILLDEIGEMPLGLQVKILRVIQEKQVDRVGENRPRTIQTRFMAATNRDLVQMVREKTFREDLYFRINVLPILVPPLRERIEDLPLLVDHFLRKYGQRDGHPISGITPEAVSHLESRPWPGNIRELENVIQRAVVMTTGNMIDLQSVALSNPTAPGAPPMGSYDEAAATLESMGEIVSGPLGDMLERKEKRLIEVALDKMNDHRQETADLLEISRKSLHNKMQKYGLLKSRART